MFISLVGLSTANAVNAGHSGRGYGGGRGPHGGMRAGLYYGGGYRQAGYGYGYRPGLYGARACAPVAMPGYWLYDAYGNPVQWVNGYYR